MDRTIVFPIKKVEAAPDSSSEGVTNDARPEKEPERKVRDIIDPALPIAGLSGVTGLLWGGLGAILKPTKNIHYTVGNVTATGIQFAVFATSFDISRSSILYYSGRENATSREKVQASAGAGAIGGALASTIRGSIRALPAAVLCTLLGAAGQYSYNRIEARSMNQSPPDENAEKHPWLNSRFSPVTVVTDEMYKGRLQEKLLSVNAQIALIDESIEAFRKQEKEEAESN